MYTISRKQKEKSETLNFALLLGKYFCSIAFFLLLIKNFYGCFGGMYLEFTMKFLNAILSNRNILLI